MWRPVAALLLLLTALSVAAFATFVTLEAASVPGFHRVGLRTNWLGRSPARPCAGPIYEPLPFDAAAWRALSEDDPDELRVRMLDALLRDESLVGRSAAEVQELLGPMRLGRQVGGRVRYLYEARSTSRLRTRRLFVDVDARDVVVGVELDPPIPRLPARVCEVHWRLETP